MNCPSDEMLGEFVDSPESFSSDSSLSQHVNECSSCAAKIRSAELLFGRVADAMATDVPESVFLVARSRIESHETRKRQLQFSVAIVATMVVCLTSLTLFQSESFLSPSPFQATSDQHKSESSPQEDGVALIDSGDASETAMATVSAGPDSIVVPIETESREISIFMIYPTVNRELSDDSTLRHQPISSIARS